MVALLSAGRRRIRLSNGHEVVAGAPRGVHASAALLGDAVTIEIAYNQLKGWRMVLPPQPS